jgi:hypothetical protein
MALLAMRLWFAERADRSGFAWWEHALSAGVVAVLFIALWKPTTGALEDPAERARKLESLTTLLADPAVSAASLERQLAALGPYPPEAQAARALADALVACKPSALTPPARQRLVEQLYVITVPINDDPRVVTRALVEMPHSLNSSGCPPSSMDAVLSAARRVATTEPNPRRDWW